MHRRRARLLRRGTAAEPARRAAQDGENRNQVAVNPVAARARFACNGNGPHGCDSPATLGRIASPPPRHLESTAMPLRSAVLAALLTSTAALAQGDQRARDEQTLRDAGLA